MANSYLPRVSPNIGFSLEQEIRNRDDEIYLEEQLSRLDEENPAISTWIRKYAELTDDSNGVKLCGVIVYRLLESQSEADQMLKDIPLE